jgi:hypothetical protein
MSDTLKDGAEYVTATELAEYGLTPQDVRSRCPWAIEYTALDQSPCLRREDLTELLTEEGGES